MRIGIITGLTEGQKTGIGVYTETLLSGLRQIDKTNEYIQINTQNTYYPAVLNRHPYGYYVWQLGILPVAIHELKPDVLHDPFGNLACFSFLTFPFRKVITLHDIAPIVNPENFSPLMVKVHKFLTPRAIARADAIITDSEFSKSEIVNYYKINPDKVRVIYPAVNIRFKPVSKRPFASPYILYVGAIQKQKNIQALLRAYALIKKNIPHKVVIVGRQYATGDNDLPALAHELGITDSVIFTGYVSDAELPDYYSSASVFVFPSLYEGFGLPPLEAMACGCPVVCSNRAALQEAAGDGALMVDPDNIKSMANLIHLLATDATLQAVMVRAGYKQASKFTCKSLAEKTLKVYEEVMK